MATTHTTPSTISLAATTYTPTQPRGKIYITALLVAGDLVIDGVSVTAVGPLNLSSPIACDTFTTTLPEQVAYYAL